MKMKPLFRPLKTNQQVKHQQNRFSKKVVWVTKKFSKYSFTYLTACLSTFKYRGISRKKSIWLSNRRFNLVHTYENIFSKFVVWVSLKFSKMFFYVFLACRNTLKCKEISRKNRFYLVIDNLIWSIYWKNRFSNMGAFTIFENVVLSFFQYV
jgi:hypothetical protein